MARIEVADHEHAMQLLESRGMIGEMFSVTPWVVADDAGHELLFVSQSRSGSI